MKQQNPPANPRLSALDRHLAAAIIESSDDAIISKDLDGIITSWNNGARKLFGYTPEEAIGRPISLIIPPDRGFEEPDILARIRRGERLGHFETIRQRKDGTPVHVSLTISPIYDESGKVVGAAKIARDVTPAKVALDQTRLEREQLLVTLSSIGDGVIVTDASGFVQFLNPVAEKLTGWAQEQASGKPLEVVFTIINELNRRRVENPAFTAMAQGSPVPLANHTLLLARNGHEVAIDDSAAPIRNAAGDVSGVVLVFRDVTARRATQELRARLSAIVECSDDAIVGKNLDGRITSWNTGAERIFGYSQEEAVGRPITLIIPPDRLAEETDILRRIRAGERVDHFETVRISKDRRLIDVSLTISPVKDSEGNVVGASKIARDITEKKKAERELKEANEKLRRHSHGLEELVKARTAELQASLEELETFSSGLSHDLKAPLRAISGQAHILREDFAVSLPAEAQEALAKIEVNCARLSRFVDNVLSYARLRSGGLSLANVDLDRLVASVITEYPHVAQANAEVEIESPLLVVKAHESLLSQVLANLISNGVKFVPPSTRPRLRIWTENKASTVRLCIQDNGIGIAPADQNRIFALFSRAQTDEKYEGHGIGLAVVQRAVQRMGGEVGVQSEKGKGSQFWVELQKPS